MSGTISISMSQQFDAFGKPLGGGKLFFYQAGTTTPQSAYQDSDLTIPHPNPITLDAAGRIPQFHLADGQIKIRLTNASGVQQLAADNILVVGASSGGGGGGSVDPTTIYQTGDLKPRYDDSAHAGFVRCNGRTIGRSTSGATERANADCQALFEYLWNKDAGKNKLTISGGRGVSAAADWAADKTIALPGVNGRTVGGLDGMGNTPAGNLTEAFFGSDPNVLGAIGGSEKHQLTQAQLPGYNLTGTTDTQSAIHRHEYLQPATYTGLTGGGIAPVGWQGGPTAIDTSQEKSLHTHTITIPSGGGNAAHNNTPPMIVVGWYIKL